MPKFILNSFLWFLSFCIICHNLYIKKEGVHLIQF
uniref:Uncharacterized protein n=1 Tax=virus sp. ctML55 TaxID=2827627 RepID=A0A8S5RHH8_9VIRU|nr:MAG TPA: hypothetical protein [virus sp. ctML55]